MISSLLNKVCNGYFQNQACFRLQSRVRRYQNYLNNISATCNEDSLDILELHINSYRRNNRFHMLERMEENQQGKAGTAVNSLFAIGSCYFITVLPTKKTGRAIK